MGATVVPLGSAVLTHRPGLASEPTATFLHGVDPPGVEALESVLDAAAGITGVPCPRVFLGPGSPPWLEAEPVTRDWHVEAILQLVLPAHRGLARTGDAAARPARESGWTQREPKTPERWT